MDDRLPNIHPGDVLREDYLKPLNMSAYRLAKSIGVSQIAISQILRGQRSVTPAMAMRLSRFFGSTPEFWLRLQMRYDLEELRDTMADELVRIQPCPHDAPQAA